MEAPPSTTDEKAPEDWREHDNVASGDMICDWANMKRRPKLGERNQGSREHVFAAQDEQLKGRPPRPRNKAGASSFPPNYG